MNKKTNFMQLALDLRRGVWFIKATDDLLPLVERFLSKAAGAEISDEPYRTTLMSAELSASGKDDKTSKGNQIAIVPIHGSLTKYDTCETYGTVTIASEIDRLSADRKIAGILLDIDSPGGSSNAVAPLTEAIARAKALGKPVAAHCDACFSAAYWVASQCDAIFCDNPLSELGSIGAYCVLVDNSKSEDGSRQISIYAKESPDKNLAYREALEGKPEKIQQRLSVLVRAFQDAVKNGRPSLNADAPGVMTGADFYAPEAIGMGMADGYATLSQAVENVALMAQIRE